MCAHFTQAQNLLISGKVSDRQNHSVYKAIIKLSHNGINKFTLSDKDGEYQFEVLILNANDSFTLEITHLSFENRSFSFLPDTTKENNYFYTILQERYKTLEAVKVNPDIYEKGDTTFINANAFRKITDENVNDLLKNIPGMRVLENGLISYQGKIITDLTVEGAKFSNDYTQITNNLSAKQVDEVQVIKNYNEIAALRGFEQDGLAINLKLKQDRKLKLSSKSEFGAGLPDKYVLKTSTLILQPAIKSMLLANLNNIGFNPYNEGPVSKGLLEKNKYNLDGIGNVNSLLLKEPTFATTSSYNTNVLPNINRSKFGVLNSIIPVSEKLSININTGYYKDRFARAMETSINFYETPQLNYLDRYEEIHQPEKFKAGAELTYSDTTTYLKIGINSYNGRFKNTQLVSNPDQVFSVLSSKNNLINGGIYATRRLGKSIAADILLQHSNDHITQLLHIDNENEITLWNRSIKYREQNFKTLNKEGSGEVNLYLKNFWISRIKFLANNYHFKPVSYSAVRNANGLRIDSFFTDKDWYRTEYGLTAESNWKWKKFSTQVNAGVMFAQAKKDMRSQSKFYPALSLQSEYKITNNRSFSFVISNSSKFDYLNLLSMPYFSSYRTISQFSNSHFYRTSYSVNALYSTANRSRTRNFMMMYASYFYRPVNIYTYESFGSGIFLNRIDGENILFHQSQNIFFNYDKMITKLGMGTKSNLSINSYRNFLVKDSFNRGYSVRFQTAFKKSFADWIAVEIGGLIRINGLISTHKTNFYYYPNIVVSSNRQKPVNYSVVYKPIFAKSQTLSTNFQSLDGQLSYQPVAKKYSFELKAGNLFNAGFTQSAYAGPYFETTYREFVMPRFLMLKMNYALL